MQRLGPGSAESLDADDEASYCAKDLLEALCHQRKFFQQRSGLPDIHRAAVLVIKDFVSGRLQSWKLPPTSEAGQNHGLSELAALGLI